MPYAQFWWYREQRVQSCMCVCQLQNMPHVKRLKAFWNGLWQRKKVTTDAKSLCWWSCQPYRIHNTVDVNACWVPTSDILNERYADDSFWHNINPHLMSILFLYPFPCTVLAKCGASRPLPSENKWEKKIERSIIIQKLKCFAQKDINSKGMADVWRWLCKG